MSPAMSSSICTATTVLSFPITQHTHMQQTRYAQVVTCACFREMLCMVHAMLAADMLPCWGVACRGSGIWSILVNEH